MMDYTKRAFKGTLAVLIMYFLSGILGYLFRFLLARKLDPANYGLFYAVFSFVMFFTVFTGFGVGSALVKFIPEFQIKKKYEEIKNSVLFTFLFQFFISLIIAAIFYLLSNWLAINYFNNEAASLLLKILSVVFVLLSFNVFSSSLQGFQKIAVFASVNTVKALVLLIATFFLFMFNQQVIVPAYGYLIAHVVSIVFAFVMFLKTFPDFFKYKLNINKKIVKNLFGFGIPIALTELSYLVLSYTDTLMITYFKTLNDVAFYNVAVPIAMMLLWIFAHPLAAVMLPMSSEMWNKRHVKSLKNGLQTIHKYVMLGIIPAALVLIAFPDLVISILFGSSYIPAQNSLKVLAFGMLFYSIAFINSHVLAGIGKPSKTTKIMVTAAIANVVLNFIFIPIFGIVGAAIATVLSYILMMNLTSLELKKYIHIELPFFYFFKTIFVGALVIAAIYIMKKILVLPLIPELIIILTVAAVLYALLSLAFKLWSFEEIKSLFLSRFL
jgi:O-antigen/teichoic acid export membrane protein